jgi:thioredoxin reductase (NADPH)
MPTPNTYDLAIIGAGPAGLSAGLTAGSEGLDTLVLEANGKFGGQASQSTLIENYGGFPDGVVGEELMAGYVGANRKFGVTLRGLTRVTGIEQADEGMVVRDDGGMPFYAGAVILSPGVQYRRLEADNVDTFLGSGVSYVSPTVRDSYINQEIYIAGAGNSAGQAASHLAKSCEGCGIHILVRGGSIEKGMSPYLTERLKNMPNVTIHTNTEVERVDGERRLKSITLRNKEADTTTVMPADELFILIGANPKTQWLQGLVELDTKGFIPTGGALSDEAREQFVAACGRQPQAYETSQPGLFAVGDIRHKSTKRVASAHGQGAVVIGQVKDYLDLRLQRQIEA